MKKLSKKRIFDIIQIGNLHDFPSRVFDIIIVAAIVLNILSLILETFPELSAYMGIFKSVEHVTLLFFIIEYILRIWTSEYLYPGLPKKKAVLRFLLSYDGIVDLLTILPFFFLEGFVAFRFLRVARIFHLFRINALHDSFSVITTVIYDKRNQLLSSIYIIWVLILASSLCLYNAEHRMQPDVFKNALSGVWYSIATIFTVGYGDIYPVTAMGRIMAGVITFLGVGAVAIPTGIISAGFVEQYTKISGMGNGVRSVKVTGNIPLAGRTVGSLDYKVALMIRDGEPFVPLEITEIKEGDILIRN